METFDHVLGTYRRGDIKRRWAAKVSYLLGSVLAAAWSPVRGAGGPAQPSIKPAAHASISGGSRCQVEAKRLTFTCTFWKWHCELTASHCLAVPPVRTPTTTLCSGALLRNHSAKSWVASLSSRLWWCSGLGLAHGICCEDGFLHASVLSFSLLPYFTRGDSHSPELIKTDRLLPAKWLDELKEVSGPSVLLEVSPHPLKREKKTTTKSIGIKPFDSPFNRLLTHYNEAISQRRE